MGELVPASARGAGLGSTGRVGVGLAGVPASDGAGWAGVGSSTGGGEAASPASTTGSTASAGFVGAGGGSVVPVELVDCVVRHASTNSPSITTDERSRIEVQ
jgi:hypothetical protein